MLEADVFVLTLEACESGLFDFACDVGKIKFSVRYQSAVRRDGVMTSFTARTCALHPECEGGTIKVNRFANRYEPLLKS